MMTLLIKQSLKNGSSKSWKIRSTKEPQTFGTSRLANLISISPASEGIEGIFEFKGGNWWYHSLNFQTLRSSQAPSICINTEIKITLGDSEILLTPIERSEKLLQKLEAIRPTTSLTKSSRQLFIAKQNEQIVDIQVLPIGKKYKGILAFHSEAWSFESVGNLRVQQRSVHLEDIQHLTHLSSKEFIDDDSKNGAYAVLGCTVLCLLASFWGPTSEKTVTMVDLPKVAQKIIVKTDIKSRKKNSAAVNTTSTAQKMPQQTAPAEKLEQNPAPGGKVANMMKSLSGGRISQLIGKVSSQAARSANIVITNGIKAGQGGSGRALASLGGVEKSGRDWGSDSGGKDVVVSTAGRGGGKNASGMGGLAQGKTGSGGVGLIEEESEISGGLDREIIAQYIKSQLGQILYCYERQLSASPDLFGKIAVKFTIGSSGTVERQLIGDTTLKNATVEGCILNRVAAWKFPAPQGGTKVLVTYPFLFKSTN